MGAFVGRVGELRVLCDAISAASGEDGAAILVSGEPGIGKTRLIDEAAAWAAGEGFQVVRGACPPEGARPFHPFHDALGAALFEEEGRVSFADVLAVVDGRVVARASRSQEGPTGVADMLAAVQDFVADTFGKTGKSLGRLEFGDMTILSESDGRATVVAVLAGAEHEGMRPLLRDAARRVAEEPASAATEVEAAASRRFLARRGMEGVRLDVERNRVSERVTAELSRRAGEAPLLLVVEDVHWADEPSLFALEYVARNARPEGYAVLVSARPGSPRSDALAARMAAAGAMTRVELRPMDESGVRGLLAAEMSPNDFPPELPSRLAADCHGNPFFLTEMLRQMLADGAIVQSGGRYSLSSAPFSVPSSIEEMAERRLAALDAEAATMAEYAACIGREFDVGAALSLATAGDPSAALERLAGHGIVATDGERATFVHALFQDAVYRNITPRWRQAHHKSLGEHLERAFAGRLDDALYELARHFSRTNEHQKAHRYCVGAGEKAEMSFAAEQAASHYEAALSALSRMTSPRPGEREELLERLGDALMASGSNDRALERYAEALSSAPESLAKARLRRRMSVARERKGDFAGAVEEVAAGMALVGEGELEYWRLLLQKANSVQRRGDFDDVIAIGERALEGLARFDGTERERGRALSMLGFAHVRKGRHDKAVDCFNGATAIMASAGDDGGMANVYNNLGILHYNRGELDLAQESYGRALAISTGRKDQAGVALLHNNMGILLSSRGDLQGSLDLHLKALAVRERLGDESGIAMSLVNLGETLGEMGRSDEALAHYRRNLEIVVRLGDHRGEALACSNLANELARRGDLRGAQEWFARSIEAGRRWDVRDYLVEALVGLAQVRIEEGDLDDARRLCAEAEAATASAGFKVYEAYLLLTRARLLSASGDAAGAEGLFLQAREAYAGLQAENEVAKTLMHWGEHLMRSGRGPEGQAKVLEAREHFLRRGMSYWGKRCEAVLGAFGK